jgi:hypothetical protein
MEVNIFKQNRKNNVECKQNLREMFILIIVEITV